jgi:hypothetical protein
MCFIWFSEKEEEEEEEEEEANTFPNRTSYLTFVIGKE